MIKIIFVCLGNICRSPMAEAVFRDLVEKEGLADQFEIDSAGTSSYHVGNSAHPGTRRVLQQHGIAGTSRSRQVNRADLEEADYLIAMDRTNASDLHHTARRLPLNGRVHLLLDFAPGVRLQDVPDPYYAGNFEDVYRLVEAGCRGLLAHIKLERDF